MSVHRQPVRLHRPHAARQFPDPQPLRAAHPPGITAGRCPAPVLHPEVIPPAAVLPRAVTLRPAAVPPPGVIPPPAAVQAVVMAEAPTAAAVPAAVQAEVTAVAVPPVAEPAAVPAADADSTQYL